MLGNDGRKPKVPEGRQYENLSLAFKGEESQKKPSFSDYVSKSNYDLPPSIEITVEKQIEINA